MFEKRISVLQKNPKSKVLKKGYINIYSKLTPQEERQVFYKTRYKKDFPKWNETLVYLSNKLSSYVGPKSVVLDIGCGNGNYLIDENRKKIHWAVGIDLKTEFVGKNICMDEIVIGDIIKMPFKDSSFDIVISLWVLEHLEDPSRVFSEIQRVLKPNGLFIFATPNSNFIPLKILKFVNIKFISSYLNKVLFGREEEGVFRTFYRANTIEEIKNVTENGFRFIELRYNYDPGYTSFNLITYKLSNYINVFLGRIGLNFFKPHILGVLEKR